MGLNWQQWVLIGVCVLGSILGILTIGKPREPRTPAEATVAVVLNVGMIWLIVEAGS